jgi:hypothetical protein
MEPHRCVWLSPRKGPATNLPDKVQVEYLNLCCLEGLEEDGLRSCSLTMQPFALNPVGTLPVVVY